MIGGRKPDRPRTHRRATAADINRIGCPAARAPTPTPPRSGCAGDCDGDAVVTIDELLRAVSAALGAPALDCPAAGPTTGLPLRHARGLRYSTRDASRPRSRARPRALPGVVITALEHPIPADVLAFLDQTVSPRGARHWQWKYGRGSAAAPAAFYWRDGDGRVLGFIGLMRTALLTAGGIHPAAWFVDWYVAPGQPGIGMGLLRKAEASAGILLTLQGSADTRQILPRLGWKESPAPVTWLRPLSPRFAGEWLARRAPAGLAPLARLAGRFAALALQPRPAPRPAGCELVAVERLPASYDAVGNARAAEATAMRRDSDYLNWLCADYPDGGYRLWLVRRDGADVGHLVTRCADDRRRRHRGRIVDAAWPWADAALGAWLIGEAVAGLRAEGADYVECLSSTAALTAALAAAAFRRRAAVPLWYHRASSGLPAPDRWHVTLLDCDRAYR